MFLDESLGEALRHNAKGAIYYSLPYVVCLALYFAMTTLPSYTERRGLLICLVNYVMSNISMDLMLDNMAGKTFTIFKPILVLLSVPVVAYNLMGVSADTEKMMTMAITVACFVYFYVRMAIISTQWCDYNQKPFFYIPQNSLKCTIKSD